MESRNCFCQIITVLAVLAVLGMTAVPSVYGVDYFTEWFDASDNDLDNLTVIFTPDGSASFYDACVEQAIDFPTNPSGGITLPLGDDDYEQVWPTVPVPLYGSSYNTFYVGSNGYITFLWGDFNLSESFEYHFNQPRISALFDDLNPGSGGWASWKELLDKVVVTFENVPEFGSSNSNSFQIEMFFDGMIRITWLGVDLTDALAGLSEGYGVPPDFTESDLSEYGTCDPLQITPEEAFSSSGYEGGPFTPPSMSYTITNTGTSTQSWRAGITNFWIGVIPNQGTIEPNDSNTVEVFITAEANNLP